MSLLFHLPDKVFKKMNIGRMIDIDDNPHSWLYPPPAKNRTSRTDRRMGNPHSSFSPVNHKK
jgi:hypothetical protein